MVSRYAISREQKREGFLGSSRLVRRAGRDTGCGGRGRGGMGSAAGPRRRCDGRYYAEVRFRHLKSVETGVTGPPFPLVVIGSTPAPNTRF